MQAMQLQLKILNARSTMIRKLIFSSLFAFILSSATAQSKITDRIVGKWEGVDDKKEVGALHFIDSVNILLTIPGQELPQGTYRLDTTKNPMWLDITIGDSQRSVTLKSLLAFVDEQTIKWQVFMDGNRPVKFIKETGENTVILKRKKVK